MKHHSYFCTVAEHAAEPLVGSLRGSQSHLRKPPYSLWEMTPRVLKHVGQFEARGTALRQSESESDLRKLPLLVSLSRHRGAPLSWKRRMRSGLEANLPSKKHDTLHFMSAIRTFGPALGECMKMQ